MNIHRKPALPARPLRVRRAPGKNTDSAHLISMVPAETKLVTVAARKFMQKNMASRMLRSWRVYQ